MLFPCRTRWLFLQALRPFHSPARSSRSDPSRGSSTLTESESSSSRCRSFLRRPPSRLQLQIRSWNHFRGRLLLSEAARETLGVMALPFGFTNATAAYQHALRGRFTDQVKDAHPLADQIVPYVADQTFCLKLSHVLIFF